MDKTDWVSMLTFSMSTHSGQLSHTVQALQSRVLVVQTAERPIKTGSVSKHNILDLKKTHTVSA